MIARTVHFGGPADSRVRVPYRAERDAGGSIRIYRKDVLVVHTTWVEDPGTFWPWFEAGDKYFAALSLDLKIDIRLGLEDAFRSADKE